MSIVNRLLTPVSEREVAPTVTPVAIAVNAPQNTDGIKSYFMSKGFEIDTDRENVCIVPIEELAFAIAVRYRACSGLLGMIKDSIVKKTFSFCYSLHPHTPDERKTINELADKLGEYGIIIRDTDTSVVRAEVSSAPRCINLLNGDYLEFYGRAVTERVVRDEARRRGVDFEIYSNAIIARGDETHELDMVFRVGEQVFWSEIKSGKHINFDKYRKLGLAMNVNPDRHILLAAEKTDSAAAGISWLYQFYVANIENFEARLVQMIDNAFKGENKND